MRRYTFKLYPTPRQEMILDFQARMVARLWNAMLEMEEDRWRKVSGQTGVVNRGEGKFGKDGRWRPVEKTFYSEFDFSYQITQLLAADPAWRALSTWTPRRVAAHLALAMQAFFSRAKGGAGASSGYPRYRSAYRAEWIPHRFASGCKLERKGKSWSLTLKGVDGPIHARGELPDDPIKFTDADLRLDRTTGVWTLSLAVEMPARMTSGSRPVRVVLDGIDCFARIDGRAIFAHELGLDADPRIELLSKRLSELARGTPDYAAVRRERSRLQSQEARRRREFLHEWTTGIVRRASAIELVRPRSVKAATESGSGDERQWGAKTAEKAEFNRTILAQAPATVAAMFRYKCAEAGIELHEIESDHLAVGNMVVQMAKADRRVRRELKQLAEV